jgi:hypothetical protein
MEGYNMAKMNLFSPNEIDNRSTDIMYRGLIENNMEEACKLASHYYKEDSTMFDRFLVIFKEYCEKTYSIKDSKRAIQMYTFIVDGSVSLTINSHNHFHADVLPALQSNKCNFSSVLASSVGSGEVRNHKLDVSAKDSNVFSAKFSCDFHYSSSCDRLEKHRDFKQSRSYPLDKGAISSHKFDIDRRHQFNSSLKSVLKSFIDCVCSELIYTPGQQVETLLLGEGVRLNGVSFQY